MSASGPSSASSPPPPPEQQIAFLQQLQRLLDEGSFTATYKYALLHAIADLCITEGDDSGDELTLDTEDIAERFIDLYWRQSMPFAGSAGFEVLAQNTGRQAAVVRKVRETRREYGDRLTRLKRDPGEWRPLKRDVEATVRKMPLWRLQTVGQEQVEFLYENVGRGREITLKPGVAFCFRAFYPLITEMVEGAWSQFVRRQNPDVLGETADLRSFLFGSERSVLARFPPILRDAQDDRCLYCGDPFASRKTAVDHFIPWRRYPIDLPHNFVLAHSVCNSRKADRIAAETHLKKWRDRNLEHDRTLAQRFEDAGIPHDLHATWKVARWAYGQVERAGGQVWVGGSRLIPLSGEWAEVLGEVGESA